MKIYREVETSEELALYLLDNAWSGAKDRVRSLDFNDLKSKCEELLSYGIDELSITQLNDTVWFGDLFNEEEEEKGE